MITEQPRRQGFCAVRAADGLTPRQRAVLRYLHARLSEGEPPTVREITRAFGLAAMHGTHQILGALQRKGWITISGEVRGIRLVGARLTLVVDGSDAGARLTRALEGEGEP